jgi:nucleotide-binding universal stress UspA family protein
MHTWLALPALIVLAAALVIVPPVVAASLYWRRPFRVRCPRAGRDAQIRVQPFRGAVAALLGRRAPDLHRCSLWGVVPTCHEECLHAESTVLRPVPIGTPPPRPDGPRTILVPLDGHPGSEAVLETAGMLARTAGATVRLLRVARPAEAVVTDDGRVVSYADQESGRVEREARAYLDELAPRLHGVSVRPAVRFGDPVAEILEEAEAAGAEVIAMASHCRTRTTRGVPRSVAGRLGRLTRIPIVLVPYGGLRAASRVAAETRR